MAYEVLFLIGRILVGGYYIMNGFNHFTKSKMLVGYAKSKNVPLPMLAVIVSGLLIFFGGLSLLLGIYPVVGITMIVVFLFFVTLFMHRFWHAPKEQKQIEMVNFMKNLALLGSTLMFLMISMPWSFSL